VRAIVAAKAGGLGLFHLKPRRLAELGIAELEGDESKHYAVLCLSTTEYAKAIRQGALAMPAGCTLAETLWILHKAGVGGLRGEVFGDTAATCRRVRDLF
jgi:hypothetical protein